jgi:hypothetical protein
LLPLVGTQVAEYSPVKTQRVPEGQQPCVVLEAGQHVAPGILQQPKPLFDIKIGHTVDVATGQQVRPSDEHAVPEGGVDEANNEKRERPRAVLKKIEYIEYIIAEKTGAIVNFQVDI